MQIKLTFTTKVLQLDSFWEWESQELRNGPLKAMGITWPTLKEFPSMFVFTTCLDTRQPGTVFKKLDTRQSEILTNFLEIARLIPLRT